MKTITDLKPIELFFLKSHSHFNKYDLMKIAYSKDELHSIDSAIDCDFWKTHNPRFHVTNFNSNIFGRTENILEIISEKNPELSITYKINNEIKSIKDSLFNLIDFINKNHISLFVINLNS